MNAMMSALFVDANQRTQNTRYAEARSGRVLRRRRRVRGRRDPR